MLETKDTQIEKLEEIARRIAGDCMEFPGGFLFEPYDLPKLLADPAILAHIPAYAALREENDIKEGIILAYERDIEKFSTECLKAGIDEHSPEAAVALLAYRIADLESQLAALQAKSTGDEQEIRELKEIRASLAERNAQLFERVAALQGGDVFLIEKAWVDSLENRNAFGYNPDGVVFSESDAIKLISDGGLIEGTGWPIPKGSTRPRYRYKKLAVKYSATTVDSGEAKS
jgi:hypothetical protein